MSTLQELLSQRKLSNELMEAAGGELTPESEASLKVLELEIVKKPDAIAAVLLDMELCIALLEKRENEIAHAKQMIAKQYDRLEKYTIENLKNNDLTELSGTDVTLKIQASQGSLEIIDQKLAEEFYGEEVVTSTIKVSKDKIKQDLKNGIDLKCAKIIQNHFLKIKVNKKGAKK